MVLTSNLKRAVRLDRLLRFRFADRFIKKLKAKKPSIGLRALQELVVGRCFWEQLV